MALQFNPPEWLINNYINRKQPAEIANEGVKNALDSYVQMKQQQQASQLAQEDRDIKLAGLAGEGGTNAIDTLNALRKAKGLPPLSIATPSPSPSPAPAPTPAPSATPVDAQGNPITGPVQGPTLPGVGLGMAAQQTPASGMGAPSPIIDHWNQSMGASAGGPTPPAGKPTAPDLGSDPALQEFNQIGSQAYQQKYGTKGLAKVKTALEIEKGLQEKKKPTSTPYYDASGNKLFELPAEGKVLPGSLSMENMTYVGNSEDGQPVNMDKKGNYYVGGQPYNGKIMSKNSETPTASTRSSAEFANTIMPHIQEMRSLVAQADKAGYIGPMAGRIYGEFLAGKVGTTGNAKADALLGQLRATDSLLKTGAMRVHFGARGGQQMYDHFSEMLNSGKQSAAMLNGSLNGIESFMKGYARAGRSTAPSSGVQANPGDPLGIR